MRIWKTFGKWFLWALLVIAAAVVYAFCNAQISLDYCKNMIRYNDGVAAIQENDGMTSIVTTDKGGKLLGRINFVHRDYLHSSIRSFDTLFTGTDGTLYAMCDVCSEKEENGICEIYRCDLTWGVLKKVWTITDTDEYHISPQDIPYVDNGKLYVDFIHNETGNAALFVFDSQGDGQLISVCETDGAQAEKTVATPAGTAVQTMRNGVYFQGKSIIPEQSSQNSIWNGLNYEHGVLSFCDINRGIVCHYDIEQAAFLPESTSDGAFCLCQNLRFYPDGGYTASYEISGGLEGVSGDGGEDCRYVRITCGFRLQFFLLALVLEIGASGVLWLIYMILILRIRKNGSKKLVKMIRVPTKITVLSIVITAMVSVLFGESIQTSLYQVDRSWNKTDRWEVLQMLSAYVTYETETSTSDESPALTEEGYALLEHSTEVMLQELSEQEHSQEYGFTLVMAKEDALYCIYSSEFVGAMPAKLAVSTEVLKKFQQVMDTQEPVEYEDKRSFGILSYIILPVTQNQVQMAAAISTNAYADQTASIRIQKWTCFAIFGTSFTLLFLLNIVLRIMFRRVKKLGKAMDKYMADGDSSGFDVITGRDEIAETAQALSQMSKGLEIYTNDLREGNRNYGRLLPKGILEIMGKDGISDVTVGEQICAEGLVVRFALNRFLDANPQLEYIIDFCQQHNGHVLSMNAQRLDAFFETDSPDTAWLADFLQNDPYEIGFSAQWGQIEAGSVGTERHAYLVGISRQFADLPSVQTVPSEAHEEKCGAEEVCL